MRPLDRTDVKSAVRYIVIIAVWLFVTWLGLNALDIIQEKYTDLCGERLDCPSIEPATGFLAFYAIVTGVAVSVLLERLWRP